MNSEIVLCHKGAYFRARTRGGYYYEVPDYPEVIVRCDKKYRTYYGKIASASIVDANGIAICTEIDRRAIERGPRDVPDEWRRDSALLVSLLSPRGNWLSEIKDGRVPLLRQWLADSL